MEKAVSVGVGTPETQTLESLCRHKLPIECEQTGLHTCDTCPVGAAVIPSAHLWGFTSHLQGRKPAGIPGGTSVLLSMDSFGQRNLTVKAIPVPLLRISTKRVGKSFYAKYMCGKKNTASGQEQNPRTAPQQDCLEAKFTSQGFCLSESMMERVKNSKRKSRGFF